MSASLLCFKQETAYEMRISGWSSDVCSSDLERVWMVTKARLSRLFLSVVDQHQHIADQVAHRAARRVGIVRRDRIANRGMVGDAGGAALDPVGEADRGAQRDRKSTRLNSSH